MSASWALVKFKKTGNGYYQVLRRNFGASREASEIH